MFCTSMSYYFLLYVPTDLFCASLEAVNAIELLTEVLPDNGSALFFLPVVKQCCGHFLLEQVHQKCMKLL